MADELKAIVQRMIDAGESEDNIATVIKGYKQPASENAAAHFQRGPEVVTDYPTDAPLMDRLARPESLNDIGQLLALPVDATRGLIANLPTAVEAAKKLPQQLSEAWNNTRESVAPFAQEILENKLGLSPDAINLKTARMQLQTARSATRAAETANSLPAPADVQAQAKDWLQTITKATTKSPLVDASGKSVSTPSALSEWDTNFVQRVGDQVKGGWKLSGNQVNQLRRIYQAVK